MNFFYTIWNKVASWFRSNGVAAVAEAPALELPVAEPPPVEEAPIEPLPRKKRGRYKVLEPLRRNIEETVIDVVERLEKINLSNATMALDCGEYEEALSYLIGCDFHLFNSTVSKQMEGGSKYLNPKGQSREFTEAIWPIDVAYVCGVEDGLAFSRIWTTDHASLRGRVKFVPQKCAWFAYMFIGDDGEWWADLSPVGLIGNQWKYLDEGIIHTITDTRRGMLTSQRGSTQAEADKHVGIALSIALSERYNWHVAFGNESAKALRVLLPTNPLGCLALFKSREKQADENRRAALRHWVAHHYRESNERDVAFVRDHLRGTTLFDWRGFNCEILVSQFDLEKNEFFKDQAEAWRAQRKHNRVRIKLKRNKVEA